MREADKKHREADTSERTKGATFRRTIEAFFLRNEEQDDRRCIWILLGSTIKSVDRLEKGEVEHESMRNMRVTRQLEFIDIFAYNIAVTIFA